MNRYPKCSECKERISRLDHLLARGEYLGRAMDNSTISLWFMRPMHADCDYAQAPDAANG